MGNSANSFYQKTHERGMREDRPASISKYTSRLFLDQEENGTPAHDSRKWRRARRNPSFARFVDVGIDFPTDSHGGMHKEPGNARAETRNSSEVTRNSCELWSAPQGVGNKATKVDVLEISIDQFPYLIRKSEGRQRENAMMSKYILRPLDLARLDYVLGDVASTIGSSIDEVFGSWEIWGSSWEDTLKAEFRAEDNREQEAFSESGVLEVDEMVDLQSIRDYRDLGIDRGQGALEAFIQIHERKSAIDDRSLSTFRQLYAKKRIAGPPPLGDSTDGA